MMLYYLKTKLYQLDWSFYQL